MTFIFSLDNQPLYSPDGEQLTCDALAETCDECVMQTMTQPAPLAIAMIVGELPVNASSITGALPLSAGFTAGGLPVNEGFLTPAPPIAIITVTHRGSG